MSALPTIHDPAELGRGIYRAPRIKRCPRPAGGERQDHWLGRQPKGASVIEFPKGPSTSLARVR